MLASSAKSYRGVAFVAAAFAALLIALACAPSAYADSPVKLSAASLQGGTVATQDEAGILSVEVAWYERVVDEGEESYGWQDWKYVYSTDPDDPRENVSGISFDSGTSTVTLNGVNDANMMLYVESNGADVTIRVAGSNELNCVEVYGSALAIVGDGSLTVNRNRTAPSSIYFDAQGNRGITVGESVNLNVYKGPASCIEVSAEGMPQAAAFQFLGQASSYHVATYTDSNTSTQIWHGEYEDDESYLYGPIVSKDGKRYLADGRYVDNESDTDDGEDDDQATDADASNDEGDDGSESQLIWNVYSFDENDARKTDDYELTISNVELLVEDIESTFVDGYDCPKGYELCKEIETHSYVDYYIDNDTFTHRKPGLAAGQTASVGGATYQVTNDAAATVTYAKAPKSKKSVTVPASVTINGKSYAVTAIAKNAFKGTKAKTVTIKTASLTKKGVKGCFKGAKKVKTVKVKVGSKKANKKAVKKYKKIFTKKNCGAKVTVK